MITVYFIRGEEKIPVQVDEGRTLMEAARDYSETSINEIPADCSGCCACATCHCYVDEEWLPKLSSADEDEESMLDQAFDVKKNSRLSCQIPFTEELDGIVLTLAPKF